MGKIKKEEIDRFFDYHIHLPTNTLYLGSVGGEYGDPGVDHQMAEYVIKGLTILDSNSGHSHINLILNSVGGDVYAGFAIYDAIKACKTPTKITAFGAVMSMASIIFQAANKRVMSPNSTMLLHYGSESFSGHSKNLERTAQESQRINALMERIYLEKIREIKPKFSQKELAKMIAFDRYMTPDEAIQMGLADGILGDHTDE